MAKLKLRGKDLRNIGYPEGPVISIAMNIMEKNFKHLSQEDALEILRAILQSPNQYAHDGVLNKIDPGEPMDKNIYELPPEELKKVPNVPGSLGEALDCLEKDHDFLLKGDVFTSDFIDMWITHKRKEHDALRLRPHPYEFFLYYDV